MYKIKKKISESTLSDNTGAGFYRGLLNLGIKSKDADQIFDEYVNGIGNILDDILDIQMIVNFLDSNLGRHFIDDINFSSNLEGMEDSFHLVMSAVDILDTFLGKRSNQVWLRKQIQKFN